MSVDITRVTDLTEALAIRYAVFVEEQNVPEDLERDELDATAIHVLAKVNDVPMGTARIVVNDDTGKIGRVAVLKSMRRTGIGTALVRACLDEMRSMPEVTRAALGSQMDALGFYEKLGFTAYGDIFDDAGIDHRMMELRFDT